MHALYDAGLEAGRDVSLVGFDDVPLAAHTHPPLTTLRQPRRAVGEHLAALLIDAIERRTRAAQSTTLKARLIIRRSTGPCREGVTPRGHPVKG
jgi:DNA-binding LacI/PurR family transcriptional regulator